MKWGEGLVSNGPTRSWEQARRSWAVSTLIWVCRRA